MTASARQRFLTKCRICQSRLPIRHLAITNLQPLRWPAALSRSEERGEEAASPGNQSRSRAFLEVSPDDSLSRITGCRWLCRNHPAKSGISRFAPDTLLHIAKARNIKTAQLCEETVDDVTSLWKAEEN